MKSLFNIGDIISSEIKDAQDYEFILEIIDIVDKQYITKVVIDKDSTKETRLRKGATHLIEIQNTQYFDVIWTKKR